MKLAFISDIHGNAEALAEVLEDIGKRNIDQSFILGDLCFRGPEPKRALSMVREMDVPVIKGNADEWVVRGVREGEVPEQAFSMINKERDWTYSKLDEDDINYLEGLPEELHLEFGELKIHAFHATPHSLFEVVQPDESDEVMREKLITNGADLHIYGHIHKAFIKYIDGNCLINTGSVGLPFDGVKKASYIVMELNECSYSTSIVRVDYDVEKVISQIKNTDYPNKELLVNFLEKGSV